MRHCHTLRRRASAILAVVSLLLGMAGSRDAFAQAIQLPPGKTCFSATTGLTGMIGSLGPITGGAGGSAGSYGGVAITGGTGSGATANITVSGGAVTAVAILDPGIGYIVADVLSAASANIGNVTGFSVTVASTAINSSLAGGTVGMYIPGTLSPSQTWQNSTETILNTNPVSLDLNGCAVIFGAGSYRQILYDNLGNLIWDQPVSVLPPLFAGTATGPGNAQTLSSVSTYTNGLTIVWTAAATNTAAATLNSYPIYEAGPTGPAVLTGGEVSAGSTYVSTWVQALNTGAGGWQLGTSFLSPTQAPGANTTQNATTAFVTAAIAGQAFAAPQTTVLTTASTSPYTTPTNTAGALPLYLDVTMCGSASGGGGSGSAGSGVGSAGAATTFGTSLLTANGGPATPVNNTTTLPTPATATGGTTNIQGALGPPSTEMNTGGAGVNGTGPTGASAPFGLGQGGAGGSLNTTGGVPASNATGFCAGGGAGGYGGNASVNSGWAGNAGAGLKTVITSPAATYPFVVGAAGVGGAGGTDGATGGNGTAGYISVVAHWQ